MIDDVTGSKDEIVRDTVSYTGSSYVGNILDAVTSIAIRRFLGPFLSGIWGVVQIVLSYSSFIHCGILFGAEKEIPYNRGKGEYKQASRIADVTFSFILVISLTAAILLSLWVLFFGGEYSPYVKIGLYAAAIITLLQQLYNFYLTVLRAHKKFTIIGKTLLLASFFNLIFVFTLTKTLRLYGLYISTILTLCISTFYFFKKFNTYPKFFISLKDLINIFKIGFPILIINLSMTFFRSVDRIIIAKKLSLEDLGYYGLGVILMKYILFLPTIFSSVIFPRFQEKYAKAHNHKDLKNYILTPTMILAYLMPVFILVTYFITPILIHFVLPDFRNSMVVIRLILLGSFFISLYYPASFYFITVNKTKHIVPFAVGSSLLLLFFGTMVVNFSWGMEGVAFITSLCYMIFTFSLLLHALNHIQSIGDNLKVIGEIFSVFLYFLGIAFFIDRINFSSSIFLLAFIKIMTMLFFSLPLLLIINKKTGILVLFWNLVKSFQSRGIKNKK